MPFEASSTGCQLSKFRWQKLLEFHEAVAEAKRIAKEFTISDRPSIGKVLESWERENPEDESADFRTKVILEGRVSLWITIKYDIVGKGWYVNVELIDRAFYVPDEAPVEAPK